MPLTSHLMMNQRAEINLNLGRKGYAMNEDRTISTNPTPTVITTRYAGSERRRAARDTGTHPVKVYDERAEKYYAGRTSNTSETGALLVLQRSVPIAAGDAISVAVARTSNEMVIGQDTLIPSTVVRTMSIDAFTQAVAVRYTDVNILSQEPTKSEAIPQAA